MSCGQDEKNILYVSEMKDMMMDTSLSVSDALIREGLTSSQFCDVPDNVLVNVNTSHTHQHFLCYFLVLSLFTVQRVDPKEKGLSCGSQILRYLIGKKKGVYISPWKVP